MSQGLGSNALDLTKPWSFSSIFVIFLPVLMARSLHYKLKIEKEIYVTTNSRT